MKKHSLLRFVCLLMAICSFTTSMTATEVEATLRPLYTTPSANMPFTAPLEEVGFIFDRCIKLFDGASVSILCGEQVVATAVSLEVENYDGEKIKQGTLIARFDKQNLPKGKSYSICLSKGSVGWVECYNNIRIVNMAYSFSVDVPQNLGTPTTELAYDSPVWDSSNLALCVYYGYEIAPVGSPEFLLYKNGELIDKIPADVTWDWDLGQVRPRFPQKVNFEFGVRYRLVLPAGSVSALYRDDIVNEEFALNFIGYYTEPDAPFTYKWCSLFADHSDVLNEVSFTYDIPVGVAEDAVIELYEGDCETLIQSAPAYLDTDVNCWHVCCDFGGFRMTSEKGYTIVIPDGAVYLQQFPDVKSIGGKITVSDFSGLSNITFQREDNALYYDMIGRVVKNPIPGSLYIKNGRKIIYQER